MSKDPEYYMIVGAISAVCMCTGLGALYGAWTLYRDDDIGGLITLGLVGVGLLYSAIVGWRRNLRG